MNFLFTGMKLERWEKKKNLHNWVSHCWIFFQEYSVCAFFLPPQLIVLHYYLLYSFSMGCSSVATWRVLQWIEFIVGYWERMGQPELWRGDTRNPLFADFLPFFDWPLPAFGENTSRFQLIHSSPFTPICRAQFMWLMLLMGLALTYTQWQNVESNPMENIPQLLACCQRQLLMM